MYFVTDALKKHVWPPPQKKKTIMSMEDTKYWGTEDKLYNMTVPNWHYPPCSGIYDIIQTLSRGLMFSRI